MAMTVWPQVANPLSLSLSLSAKGTGVAKGTLGFHPMKRMSSDCGCDESRQEKNKAHVLTEAKRTAMWRCAYAGKPSEKNGASRGSVDSTLCCSALSVGSSYFFS